MSANPLSVSFPILNANQIAELSGLAETVRIEEGTVLLTEGTPADALYLITDGVATVTKNLGAVEIVIAELSDGELVGEMSFAGDYAATATVRASSDVEAIRIDRAKLMTLFEKDTALGMGVFRSIALTLSRRLLQMTERFAFVST